MGGSYSACFSGEWDGEASGAGEFLSPELRFCIFRRLNSLWNGPIGIQTSDSSSRALPAFSREAHQSDRSGSKRKAATFIADSSLTRASLYSVLAACTSGSSSAVRSASIILDCGTSKTGVSLGEGDGDGDGAVKLAGGVV